MRMWCIDPTLLCRKHLLGEHNEIHKHRHIFVKGYSIKGRISPVVQIEPLSMKVRHDELANEMLKRGYKHESEYELPDLEYLGKDADVKVDVELSMKDLVSRCSECSERIKK